MGGFTLIRLKDASEANIQIQNAELRKLGVAKKYEFYSLDNVRFEYDSFLQGLGYFPEQQFPKDKIKSFQDFRQYWSPKALGETFCPHLGTLTFDCYFGRTGQKTMRAMGKYIVANHSLIKSVDGSFSTFMERGMTRAERIYMKNFSSFKF
jgi:hypothetical protein